MSVLVVGGDYLGNIEDNLKENGFNQITHISGRKKKQKTYKIPKNTDVVLILTDYINHQTCKSIKKQLKNYDTKIGYCKRSWSSIDETLRELSS
ncbi:DUF2325 domain-containing protein [Anaerosalibacter sp. Marseille-P3206]|uniref:DUF2325 domain-containing protein n=1 Tax=Anaerosalibacter sp. Marseille-P3206 TaxID=1871005 RepID=UPI0009859004|nr:DUF2325 domain-containing protein [Anaerosalibacter sp. Marseille-P3206]